jgi:subtilase family serine protease
MNLWKMGAVAVASLLGIVGTSSAPASTLQLERFGNVYAASVCGRISVPGQAHCFAKVVTDARGNILDGMRAAAGRVGRNAAPSGYGPADLQSAYKTSATAGNANYTIAIVDAYGYTNAEADLAKYRAQFGLPACTTANGCFKKYNQSGVQGSYPKDDIGWSQETALDLDMASAMCPNCHIILVEAKTPTLANLAAAVNKAVALGADAVSNSYGGSESGSGSYESAYNHPNVAITVSSGDNGYGVEFPASSPHVTAVGGTSLTRASNARGWGESAWNGAGSGCSTLYAQPAWQTPGVCNKRIVADVSAVANPSTGVAVYGPVNRRSSGWMVFGGTSVSAPLVAGIYGANGGIANYGSDPYLHLGALNDVTSGTNGSCGGSMLCTAGVGYDGPTGLGSPNGATAF